MLPLSASAPLSRVPPPHHHHPVAAGTADVLCRAPEHMFAAGGAYAAAWPRLLACALDLVDGANGSGSEGDEDEAAEQQLNAIAGYVKRVCACVCATFAV